MQQTYSAGLIAYAAPDLAPGIHAAEPEKEARSDDYPLRADLHHRHGERVGLH